MRLLGMSAVAIVTLGLLSGCTSSSGARSVDPDNVYGVYSTTVQLPDGKNVICVFDKNGGITCDWGNAQ